MKFILNAAKQHAQNLGTFVFIYKSLMLIQKRLDSRELSHHAFFAGLIGGYYVFGEYNNINYQVG